VTLTTSLDSESDSVLIEVRDEGVGIAQEHLPQLVDPFFTTKRETGGTGLGLSVSAGIVKKHGGTLCFASAPGEGTTVTLSLPVTSRRS
jgi:polar amino acid transport system substrate-binding protein